MGRAASGEPFSSFEHISTNNGLPGAAIRAITQDEEGIIWIGIESKGLCRYDGETFFSFEDSEEDGTSQLSDNHVEGIVADGRGGIWVATLNGLNRLDRASGEVTQFWHDPEDPDSLPNNHLLDVEQDALGRIFVATHLGVAVCEPETRKFRLLAAHIPDERSPDEVEALFASSDGTLWIGARNGLFSVRPGESVTHVWRAGDGTEPCRSRVFGVAETADQLWVSCDGGWFGIEPQSGHYERIYFSRPDGSRERLTGPAVIGDRRNWVWWSTHTDGVRIFHGKTGKEFRRPHDRLSPTGFPAGSIRALFEDRDGSVWIGTKFDGIYVYHPRVENFDLWKAARFSPRADLIEHPMSLAPAEEGVWVGTRESGLARLDTETSEIDFVALPNSMGDTTYPPRVYSLLRRPEGDLLVGCATYVALFNPETGDLRRTALDTVRASAIAPDGRIYLASRAGIRELDPETMTLHRLSVGEKDPFAEILETDCRAIGVDQKGRVWFGQIQGPVFCFDPKSRSIASLDQMFPDAARDSVLAARSIHLGSDGRLWIGSKMSGLVELDFQDQTFRRYGVDEGLVSNAVYGVLEDVEGNLWLSSDRGINRFDPETGATLLFGEQDGLQSQIFEPGAHCVGFDGRFYFAGNGGVNGFLPQEIQPTGSSGAVIFSSVMVGDRVLTRDRAELPTFTLEPEENQIIIAFSLLDYSRPGQSEYNYQLEGIDDQWVHGGSRNTVSYNSLPPGRYRFKVKGRKIDQPWAHDGADASFEFTLKPPFWRTPAFIASSTGSLLVAIVGAYVAVIWSGRVRRRRLEATVAKRTGELKEANALLRTQTEELEKRREELATHRDQLEQTVAERTRELALAKDRAEASDRLKSAFLANMSHEIRTPLNAVMGFAQMLAMEDKLVDEYGEYLEAILKNGDVLLALINDIIDLSVIEAGQLRLNPTDFILGEYFEELSDDLESIVAARAPETVAYEADLSLGNRPVRVACDTLRLRQILSNFVTNACKFTTQGKIIVRATYREGMLHCAVEDSGKGIADAHLEQIFKRFYKVQEDLRPTQQGTGLGLSISDQLAKLLGGRIWAESTVGKGSIFHLELPLPELKATAVPPVAPALEETPAGAFPDWGDRVFLVADDIPSNTIVLSHFLARTGARVLQANNGEEAIELARDFGDEIDLLLLDVEMPGKSGTEALAEIRRFAPKLPAIAQTAHVAEFARERFGAGEFDGFVAKPLEHRLLLAEIERVFAVNSGS